MVEILGIAIGVVGIAIALWQNRRAVSAEKALAETLQKLPDTISEQIGKTVIPAFRESIRENSAYGNNLSPVDRNDGQPENLFKEEYADVDGDGKNELLVHYPFSAHGSGLKIFGWRDMDFQEIGDLRVGTGAGFKVGDFDNDGRLEIKTEETDWDTGLPYSCAPRFTLLFRWDGTVFVEVARIKDHTDEDVRRIALEQGIELENIKND